jgi:hypothetical protein
MLACQQPNIGSGATAIGSAARAPDEGKSKFGCSPMKVHRIKSSFVIVRVLTHEVRVPTHEVRVLTHGISAFKVQKFITVIIMTPRQAIKFECLLRKQHKDSSLCSPASSQT